MLEKPNIPDSHIISHLQVEYGLPVTQVTFLPIGADINTAVYRVATEDDTAYFLKLRKGDFDEVTVNLPKYLNGQGNTAIIAPIETREGRLWANLDVHKMILYPFIPGKDGYTVELADCQWVEFGAALKRIHTTPIPQSLGRLLQREVYSPHWRRIVTEFQVQVQNTTYSDPVAGRLAAFMLERQDEITYLVERAEDLGNQLKSRPQEFVLCHSDIHAGNLLVTDKGELYIVDWDNPILAPKERDLMLIGGSSTWNNPRQACLFYQGYGTLGVDRIALAYYRYEWIIWDISAYCEQLLLTDEGGEDREQSFKYFASNFLPNHEIELACKVDQQPSSS